MSKHCRSAITAFIALLGSQQLSNDVNAAEFTVNNRSAKTYYASVCYFRPAGARSDAIGTEYYPDKWILTGWYKIQPGRSKTIFSGKADRISVCFSPGVRPNSHYQVFDLFVHENEFTVDWEPVDNKPQEYSIKWVDADGQRRSKTTAHPENYGFRTRKYYAVDAHTDFTIRH